MRRLLCTFILMVFGLGIAQAQRVPAGLKESVKGFPGSQLQVQTTGPISMELNETSRASYERLCKMAGLNVLFNPDFQNVPVSLTLKDAGILEAIDLLSLQTHNFTEILGSNTIIVARDTQAWRRQLQTQVVEAVFLATATSRSEITSIITRLRTELNLSFIGQSIEPAAILLRDTPDKIALAQNIIAGPPTQPAAVAFDVMGNLLIRDPNGVRKLSPSRFQLKPKAAGPFSFNLNDDSRTTYESLAGMAGLNILFDPNFRSTDSAPFKLDNIDIFDAMDFLSLQTGNFWEVVNSNTILVAPDNQTSRRQNENFVLKTIYLPSGSTPQKLTETITALRTLLNMSFLAQDTVVKAIMMRDTPLKVALAEVIVSEMNPTGPGQQLQASEISTGSVNRPRLYPAPATAPISINIVQNLRSSYSTIATLAGLNVTFDESLVDSGPKQFRLDNVPVLDALDLLALNTATFWQPLDSKTIIVAPDNQTNRQKIEPILEKTIALTNATTSVGKTEIVIALRTILNVRQVEARDNTIFIRETAPKMALAEKMIADLDKPAR